MARNRKKKLYAGTTRLLNRMSRDTITTDGTNATQSGFKAHTDLHEKHEPMMTIVESVADATHRHVEDLPPLAEFINPEGLNELFEAPDRTNIEVTFTYWTYRITVSTTGAIRLVPV